MTEHAIVSSELADMIDTVSSTGAIVRQKDSWHLVKAYSTSAAIAHLVDDHFRKHEKAPWCSMECFARFATGKATAANVAEARNRVPKIANECLKRGEILLISYAGPNGAKDAMRLLRPDDDPSLVTPQIELMVARKDSSREKADTMIHIVQEKQKLRAMAFNDDVEGEVKES